MSFTKSAIAAVVLLAASSVPASAAEVIFTFHGTVASAQTPGVSTGDPLTIRIHADNGGNSLSNQIYMTADLGLIELSSGSYSASYSTAFPDSSFSTDASGNVDSAQFFGSTLGTNTDTFGTNALVYLYSDAFQDFFGRANGFANITNPANYTVAFAPTGNVPEPATWAMLIGGIGGVGTVARSRRRFSAKRVAA